MNEREIAIQSARALISNGQFVETLAHRVAIRSESQDNSRRSDLMSYLDGDIIPELNKMGFSSQVHRNPLAHGAPILTASRIEDPSLPTVLFYGHGDVQPGRPETWREGLDPWTLKQEGERLYGRGTADNKGQHSIVMAALQTVLKVRGTLGFNARFFLEMSEEIGSPGIDEFVYAHREELASDCVIGCDGPRTVRETPSIRLGSRGYKAFSLNVNLREGSRHSGHWGGLLRDAGLILAQALASLTDRNGRILVKGWLPKSVDARSRKLLAGVPFDESLADAGWGEPGLTALEKSCLWTSFSVTAFITGNPDKPGSEVQGSARALCNIRYTVDVPEEDLLPALRRHLDGLGFDDVEIREERNGTGVRPSRTDPDNRWVRECKRSIEATLGKAPMVLPNGSGTLPSCYFQDYLGIPVIWIPHSYPECGQHGPNEHALIPLLEEGLALMTGLIWDLGSGTTAD
ncbi:MAG: M20/M25/M40 family metallo-hydrolase [Puniceicoccales bacterium]